jgi:Na+/melibiose symporter-like transporter
MIFIMIDYGGPLNRALVVGINQTTGYTAIAIFNKIAPEFWEGGDKHAPVTSFWYILGFMVLGLIATVTILRDSRSLVVNEQVDRLENNGIKKSQYSEEVNVTFPSGKDKKVNVFRFAFAEVSFLNNSLMACCAVGLCINYVTTFAWGLAKTWAKAGGDNWDGVDQDTADNIALTFDLAKGVLQFVFGFYSDRFGRKNLITGGLSLVAIGLFSYGIVGEFATSSDVAELGFYLCAFMMGLGTSMMYSVVIAAVAESADPSWRSSALGSYRFWRDMGYTIAGLLLGYVTNQAGYFAAVIVSAIFMVVVVVIFVKNFEEVVESDNSMEKLVEKFANEEFVIADAQEEEQSKENNL